MNEIKDGEQICHHCSGDISLYRSAPHTLRRGALLNHRYRIGGVIGEGGFGITYIGLDTLLQVRVAVKEFFPNGMVNRNNTVSNEVLSISTESAKELFSKSRENFLREARTLAKFTNEPGIVAVRDFFEENRTVYIVMEYLDGITLKNYLKQVGTISWDNTVCLLMPVLHSLKKMHDKQLIHRDISPDNIMLVGEQVKLLDFGAAREFADDKSLSVMLKHGYAPMEQYRRHGTQGAWTDVYALCATMYKCVTGKIPPDAPDRVFEDELKMPGELGIASDPAFDSVLKHGLAIRPEDRIQSVDQLIAELSAIPGIDISASPAASAEPSSTAFSAGNLSASDGEGARLSEYVPHMTDGDDDDSEITVEPEPLPDVPPEPVSAPLQETAPTADNSPKAPASTATSAEPSAAVKNASPAKSAEKPKSAEKKSSAGLIIGIVVAAVILIGGGIAAAVIIGGSLNNYAESSAESSQYAASSAPESSEAESSADSSAEESSYVSSADESSVPEQSSQAVSSQTEESSEPESSAEISEQSSASESSEGSTINLLETIKMPDPKDVFSFESGLLKVDLSIMGLTKSELKSRFGKGTMYSTSNHPVYGNKYEILLVPFDSSKNTPSYVETIDFYFLDGKLVGVFYETSSEYDTAVVKAAESAYGAPVSSSADESFWKIKDTDCFYETLMASYAEDDRIFIQKYTSSDFVEG